MSTSNIMLRGEHTWCSPLTRKDVLFVQMPQKALISRALHRRYLVKNKKR